MTCTIKINTAHGNVKKYINRYTTARSAVKKGEGGWIINHKLAVIQLVENDKKISSKDIMRGQLLRLKRHSKSTNK